jgi:DNA repair exonuclease SbcCD ATPase subunit
MRLTGLEVEGFRGFPAPVVLDLDADAVVVVGVNGAGKTSLLDAVLWALTGRVSRVEDAGGDVRCGWAQSGETRVALTLADAGRRIRVTRSWLPDEKAPRLTVDRGGRAERGVAGEAALLDTLWPAGLEATDPSDAMAAAVTRSVYLQQDLVRQFVEADSDRDRFDVLSELVGTGRVGELQLQLEQAKRAWTGATNSDANETQPLAARLERLRSQLVRSGQPGNSPVDRDWDGWWTRAKSVGIEAAVPSAASGGAAAELESALRQLDAIARAAERQMTTLDDLASGPLPAAGPHDREALTANVRAAVAEYELARQRLETARSDAAVRAKQREADLNRDRQLAELARLALVHLGDHCPVCTQTYDRDRTITHLNELIERGTDAGASTGIDAEDELPDLAVDVAERQAAVVDARAGLEGYDAAEASRAALQAERERQLRDVGLDSAADADIIATALQQSRERLAVIHELRPAGERLALEIARRVQESRRAELMREAQELERRIESMQHEIDERNLTGELAQQFLDAVRAAAADVVGLQLRHLEPLLVRLYARIDPHPVLRDVSLRSWVERGRGRLRTKLADPSGVFATEHPAAVLSTSQLNAFAVALFLALNLGVARVPIRTAMLDDPLQSLDDVNLLGLVDLLRRIKQSRQLIVTTHDVRFGELLERKLRALDGERTVRIDLTGWSRSGPVVTQRDVPPETKPLQLVA